MNRIPVNSTNVAEVGYDATTQTLEVLYHSGSTYQYFDVPQPVYEALVNASSVGQFMNSQVKGVFRYARV